MDPGAIALLVVAALAAGTVDAIAGGGGLITVPALLTAGLPPHLAYGTNKAQSVWGSGAALVTFWRSRRVDRGLARLAFPLGMLGSLLGARLVLAIPNDTLRPIAIAMLIGAAALMFVRRPAGDGAVGEGAPLRGRRRAIAAGLALAIGAYDGFFGPGTGTFLIVGFVALCGAPLMRATADAKVVNFASNLAAVATFAYAGRVAWAVALPMAAAQLAGGALGARLAMRGGARVIRIAVVVVSGAIVARLAADLLAG